MPRKKRTTVSLKKSVKPQVIHHPTPREGITAYARSSIQFTESYVSLLMGVVVIIVAVLFVVSLIRATHHIKDTSSVAIGPTISPTAQQENPSASKTKIYVVQPGDNLWGIAEKIYNDGYKWVDIAKANNLSDPSIIFSGNQLNLPEITPLAQTSPTPSQLGQIVTQEKQLRPGSSYTVVAGDTLWDIAVRAYNDGYKWVDIAKANQLTNPDIIHRGNVFMLPR